MSIATEYAKSIKTPLIWVKITRFFTGVKPSIEGFGYDYFPQVVSCTISHGFDQGSATCSLVIKSPLDVYGNAVRFQPMDRVQVKQGWNYSSTLDTTFFGFIDMVDFSTPPDVQKMECRDILKLAQDYYLIHSNRRLYYVDPVPSEVDFYGNVMGGQLPENRTVEAVIRDLLTDSGIPESRQSLDFVPYFDDYGAVNSGCLVVGGRSIAEFEYESALDGISRVCDLIGYKTWATKSGIVKCREVKPFASSTPTLSYTSATETYVGSGIFVSSAGNLINADSTVDDDLRNWVTVIGYSDDISTTVYGDSDYVPDPPRYRRTEVVSRLLDTQEMVILVANTMYSDLNRLRYTATARIEGDPRLELGQTISIYDPFVTVSAINYFLYDYSSNMEAGSWFCDLTLVGGTGAGAPPADNVSPVSVATYTIEKEYTASGIMWDVHLDGTDSYDPDGDYENLNFVWNVSGVGTYYTDKASFFVTSDTLFVPVILTVYDSGVPALSDETTFNVESTGTGDNAISARQIYIANGKLVYSTANGGLTWNNPKELF